MVSCKQHLLNAPRIALAGLVVGLLVGLSHAQSSAGNPKKFYPDDPLWREPAPRPTSVNVVREIDELSDFVENRFVTPAVVDKKRKDGPVPAGNVNTLGEVPDSNWYTNRHGQRRMSIAELQRGAGNSEPPGAEGTWQIVAAKSDGITPGLVIEDHQGRRFVIKFDSPYFPELASAADMICSKFFYALGYNTPENYIVHFRRENLSVKAGVVWRDATGKRRTLTEKAVNEMLKRQPKNHNGNYRALASRWITGTLVGPFSYKGTRSDDPNDIVRHEDRREMRGLRVFGAWLNHTDTKQMNTMDTLVTENGYQYIKHYLIDFGSTLGSDADLPKNAWRGHVYPFSPGTLAAAQILTLGVYTPAWLRANYPKFLGAGAFEYETFDPEAWIPDYPNPAFLMMDDEDAFWAAKQVLAFRDDEIRAIVETGEFSDPNAASWVAECLIQRRNKIAQTWLAKLLPFDNFRIENGRLAFDDLAAIYGLPSTPSWDMRWYAYNNDSGTMHRTPLGVGAKIPPGGTGGYLAAVIQCVAPDVSCRRFLTIFMRPTGSGYEVVGVNRQFEVPSNFDLTARC